MQSNRPQMISYERHISFWGIWKLKNLISVTVVNISQDKKQKSYGNDKSRMCHYFRVETDPSLSLSVCVC